MSGGSNRVRLGLARSEFSVDVDLTLRAFHRHHLANPVQVARDGEEALGWMARWEAGEPLPAVILLDLNLPRVDGLTVL